jgi:hypothetical protein
VNDPVESLPARLDAQRVRVVPALFAQHRTHLLGAGRIDDVGEGPAEDVVDAPREMVAHAFADLRDLHLLVQREEHTDGLNRSRYVDRLTITIVHIGHGDPRRATATHARTHRTSPWRAR